MRAGSLTSHKFRARLHRITKTTKCTHQVPTGPWSTIFNHHLSPLIFPAFHKILSFETEILPTATDIVQPIPRGKITHC